MSAMVSVKELQVKTVPAILLKAQEEKAQRLMMVYAITGLFFMLLPGTFLGVWNLISISGHRGARHPSQLDSGPWPRPDLWLDRHIHSWHRLLLHSQDGKPRGANIIQGLGCLDALDGRCFAALGRGFLSSILARGSALFSLA